jgi:hypothetical protein
VDIVNQSDFLEGRAAGNKLGQPMVHFVYTSNSTIIEIAGTTYSRPLQFPGLRGRLQPGMLQGQSTYEIKNAQYKPDVAIRLSKNYENTDFALSHYHGTNRLPIFNFNNNTFTTVYEEIDQTGAEWQWLTDAFIWKGEFIHVVSQRKSIQAFTIGGEYNLAFRAGAELKWMLEYTYDERGKEQISGINNDLFAGLNLNFNDRQSTNLLLSGFYDFDFGTTIFQTRAERRVGEVWKIAVTYLNISNTTAGDFYYLIRNDSFFEISLLNYFSKK